MIGRKQDSFPDASELKSGVPDGCAREDKAAYSLIMRL
jgi:hypothetical protein